MGHIKKKIKKKSEYSREWGREESGVWNQQMQTITYRMDKQQSLSG